MTWDPEREAYWRQQPWRECSNRELERRLPEHRATIAQWRQRVGEPWVGQQYTQRAGVPEPVPLQGAGVPSTEPPPTPPNCQPEVGEMSPEWLAHTLHPDNPPPTSATNPQPDQDEFAQLSRFCKKEPRTLDEVCDLLNCGPTNAQGAIVAAQAVGHPLQLQGGRLTWHMPEEWAEDVVTSPIIQPSSGWTQIAFVSDTHFGSKHERADHLADFFNEAYGRGCRMFFHSGDMVDGEYKFGLRERYAHGFDEQAAVAAEKLPQRKGAHWYVVDGNHDETLSNSSGAVFGRALVERFRSLGREDVTFQGQRLGHIRLCHEGYDYQPLVELWHPKRGKAYADSYGIQKRVEGYQPGCKPDILAIGHWHAYCHIATRGVHGIAVPCFQGGDSPFGRSLVGQVVLGGVILNYSLTEHGTLRRVSVELVQYFERETARVVAVAK